MILGFSRDSWVRKNSLYEIHKPIFDLTCDLESDDPFKSETAPPCGVQPFLGLASYFAPLGGAQLLHTRVNTYNKYIHTYMHKYAFLGFDLQNRNTSEKNKYK